MTLAGTTVAAADRPPVDELTVGILGPVIVRSGSRSTDIPRIGQRILLAMLALGAGKPVATETLIDAVWGESPSRQRERNLHVHMYQLRRLLAGVEPGREQPRIVTASPGYRLILGAGELDSQEFAALAERGRAAARAGDAVTAARLLADGLAMWRGPALADVTEACIRLAAIGERLDAKRLAVLEDRVEADLVVGAKPAGSLAAELAGLVSAHPTRERLRGQLMVALYRSGRQADALETFRQGRQVLNQQLGQDPGPELAALHQRILAGDPQLAGPQPDVELAAPRARPDQPAAPRQLPPSTPHFVGRSAELATLDGVLSRVRAAHDGAGQDPGAVVVVSGTAGIGKTTLAVHWAHTAAADFPDGQLYADLRGYDVAGLPATAAEVIRSFLGALGVSDRQVPASTEGQASLYRTLVAGRRVLMVLDNARDAAQVRPLLPSSQHSLVVVTTRSALPGLTVTNGAVPLILALPAAEEATRLLAARVGAARLAAEPAAAADIVSLCAYLPLAIALTAAQAVARPDQPLSVLAARLQGQPSSRLDVLEQGNSASTLRDVFACSYRQLSGPSARLFRLLGLPPGPDISVPAAASLAATPAGWTRHALAELTAASLVTEVAQGRYVLHDLLRAYAAELAASTESAAQRDAAIRRLLDYYLHSASAAAGTLHPRFVRIVLADPADAVTPEQFGAHEQATAWFRAEHQSLLAAVTYSAESGYETYAWQLPLLVANTWLRQGQLEDLAVVSRVALVAAGRIGDPQAIALAQERMANVCYLDESYEAAARHAQQALAHFERAADLVGQADAHAMLGWALGGQGQYAEALGHAAYALTLYRQEGHRPGEASGLRLTGWLHAQQSEFAEARDFYQQALDAYREVGGAAGQADAWDNLGHASLQLGDYERAMHSHRQAAAMAAAAGHRRGQVHSLIRLGDACDAAGDRAGACEAWQQALDLIGDMRHPEADRIRAELQAG